MILAIPKEILVHEARVAALPESVERYVEMGLEVVVHRRLFDFENHVG